MLKTVILIPLQFVVATTYPNYFDLLGKNLMGTPLNYELTVAISFV